MKQPKYFVIKPGEWDGEKFRTLPQAIKFARQDNGRVIYELEARVPGVACGYVRSKQSMELLEKMRAEESTK